MKEIFGNALAAKLTGAISESATTINIDSEIFPVTGADEFIYLTLVDECESAFEIVKATNLGLPTGEFTVERAQQGTTAQAFPVSATVYHSLTAETAALMHDANFWDLGPHAAPPTLDRYGDPLQEGHHYFDTVLLEVRYWNGTSWQTSTEVSPISVVANKRVWVLASALTAGNPLPANDSGGNAIPDLEEGDQIDIYVNGVQLIATPDPAVYSGDYTFDTVTDEITFTEDIESGSVVSATIYILADAIPTEEDFNKLYPRLISPERLAEHPDGAEYGYVYYFEVDPDLGGLDPDPGPIPDPDNPGQFLAGTYAAVDPEVFPSLESLIHYLKQRSRLPDYPIFINLDASGTTEDKPTGSIHISKGELFNDLTIATDVARSFTVNFANVPNNVKGKPYALKVSADNVTLRNFVIYGVNPDGTPWAGADGARVEIGNTLHFAPLSSGTLESMTVYVQESKVIDGGRYIYHVLSAALFVDSSASVVVRTSSGNKPGVAPNGCRFIGVDPTASGGTEPPVRLVGIRLKEGGVIRFGNRDLFSASVVANDEKHSFQNFRRGLYLSGSYGECCEDTTLEFTNSEAAVAAYRNSTFITTAGSEIVATNISAALCLLNTGSHVRLYVSENSLNAPSYPDFATQKIVDPSTGVVLPVYLDGVAEVVNV